MLDGAVDGGELELSEDEASKFGFWELVEDVDDSFLELLDETM